MKLSQQSWTNLFTNTVTWTMGTIAVAMLYPLTRAQAVFAQTTAPLTHVREDNAGALVLKESLNQRRTSPCTNSTDADPKTFNQQTALQQTNVNAVADENGGVTAVFMSTKPNPYQPLTQRIDQKNRFQLSQEFAITNTVLNKQNPSIVRIPDNNGTTKYFMYLYNAAPPSANVWLVIYSPDFQQQPGFDGTFNPQLIGTPAGGQQLNIAGTSSNLNGESTLETVYQAPGISGSVISQRGLKPNIPGGPPVQAMDATPFVICTNNTVNNLNPDIDTNPLDGSTVTVWEQCPTSGYQICNLALRGVSRDSAGNPVYLDAKEKTYIMPGYDLRNGRIKFLKDGSGEFLMSFIGARPTDTYYTAYVQRFRANRTVKGAAIPVPTLQIIDNTQSVAIDILPNGFAVSASSTHAYGMELGYLQKFYNNNTLNGNLIPLDPTVTNRPQVSPAVVYRGGDPANERVTVLWDEYISPTNTDDIRMQTWSKNAVLNYNGLSIIEDSDTVSLTNLYIEQLYDAPSQLDITMSLPPDAGTLICGGNTASNGTLPLSASGANCLDAINNIIGCCTYKPAANYNGAFNIQVDIAVNGGTPTTTFIPVTVASVNDVPVVTVNATNIRQGKYTFLDNISVYDPDNTSSQITINFSNEAGGSVRTFDQTTQTVGANSLLQITAAEAENRDDVFLQDGTTTAPIAQLQACDGIGCSPVTNLIMNFQPDNMPQIDNNDVPITENKIRVLTKSMLSSSDPDPEDGETVRRYTFFNQVNGQIQVKKNGVWSKAYTFLESDVGTDEQNSNVQIVPKGKAAYSAQFTLTDGVLTTQQFPLGVTFTQAKTSSSLTGLDFSNPLDVLKLVGILVGGLGSAWGAYKYLHNDYVKDEDNSFANRIKKKLNIDVDFTKFSTFIDNLAGSTILDSGSNSVKYKVDDLVDKHHHWSPFGCWVKKEHQLAEDEINELVQIFAVQLAPYIRANEKKTSVDIEQGDNQAGENKEAAKKENSCFKKTMVITSVVLGKPFNLRRAENELVKIKENIEKAINNKNKTSPSRLKRMQTYLGSFIPNTGSSSSVEMSNTSLGNNSLDKLQL
jgi:hypothetical protein